MVRHRADGRQHGRALEVAGLGDAEAVAHQRGILGADHGGYVARMTAAVKAVGGGKTKFEAVLCQIVHIMRGG